MLDALSGFTRDRRRLLITCLLLVAFALIGGGCALSKKALRVVGIGNPSVKFIAQDGLNVKDKRPYGILHVRAYLLSDAGEFTKSSYEGLWIGQKLKEGENGVLEIKEAELASKDKSDLTFKPKKGAKEPKYIGILAGYADPESDEGRKQLVEIGPKRSKVIVTFGPRGMRPAVVK